MQVGVGLGVGVRLGVGPVVAGAAVPGVPEPVGVGPLAVVDAVAVAVGVAEGDAGPVVVGAAVGAPPVP
ncbi:hypothetical protein [Streptomyces sp. NRRL B-24572]|uniref:hypothetical protein n=1 Tax=Streptomyces sp. NRRL B-24572 TaxID=1962156 RepID=UPI0015C50A9F|nr:hypothetical protein [Streptomyces sp. NRRL B-24572]